VTPFRLFSISLLFRMSSKISDACTKAAGAVYSRAVLQFAYAAMVVVGAIIGQQWGVGGVAVAVSIAMGINWQNMAWLGRRETGLSWWRFTVAQMPAAMLAVATAGMAAVAAHLLRGVHLPGVLVLSGAALAGVATAVAAARVRPALFLGPHGSWMVGQARGMILGRGRGRRNGRRASGEELVAAGDMAGE
jgi:PST family polysaccharide transporter